MSVVLREDTASQEVMLGPFVDTDGAPVTSLTIANTDIRLQKAAAATFANKNSGGATHIEDGYYLATFDATDSDTPGPGLIQCAMAGALPVRHAMDVLPQDRYDSRYGTGAIEVNVTAISGDTTAADNLEAALDGTGYNLGNGWVVAQSVTGNVGGDVIGQVLGSLTRTDQAQAGSATTITLDAGASATDDLYNNQLIALIAGTGVGQARFITDYVGATKVATVATWTTAPDSTSVFSIVPFGAIPGATAPTASQVADEVQTRTIAAVTTVNGLGANVVTAAALAADASTEIAAAVRTNLTTELGRIDAAVSTRASQTSVDDLPTNAELATALASADDAVLGAVAALNNLSEAGVRAAVGLSTANLDTQLADLPTTAELATALGTADDAILAAIAALNNLSEAQVHAQVDQALVDAALATAANLAAAKVVVDAIQAKTDALPANPAATGDAMALTSAAVDAVLDDVVEGTVTVRQMLRLFAASLGGKLSGAATSTIAIRDLADSKDRVTATVDADGNRTAVTLDLT